MNPNPLLMDEAREFLGLPPLKRRTRKGARQSDPWLDLSFLREEPAAAKLDTTAKPSDPAEPGAGVSLAEIGECLRAAREDEGLSLGELEEQTGMSRALLSRIENRITPNPTINTLDRIAAALGLRIVVSLSPLGDEQGTTK